MKAVVIFSNLGEVVIQVIHFRSRSPFVINWNIPYSKARSFLWSNFSFFKIIFKFCLYFFDDYEISNFYIKNQDFFWYFLLKKLLCSWQWRALNFYPGQAKKKQEKINILSKYAIFIQIASDRGF